MLNIERLRVGIREFRSRPFDRAASVVALNLAVYSIPILILAPFTNMSETTPLEERFARWVVGMGGGMAARELSKLIAYQANRRGFHVENRLLFIGRFLTPNGRDH